LAYSQRIAYNEHYLSFAFLQQSLDGTRLTETFLLTTKQSGSQHSEGIRNRANKMSFVRSFNSGVTFFNSPIAALIGPGPRLTRNSENSNLTYK